ncbi:MAG: hypothetical protein IIA88_01850 [Bacteroidetes bacterium]|nr:hypothetical protein [Bacteroidota bacterium]
MDKEIIDKRIKNEIELFKVYSFLLVSLTTGVSVIIISKSFIDEFISDYIRVNVDKIIFILFIIGIISFIVVFVTFMGSFIKIRKLTKKLIK